MADTQALSRYLCSFSHVRDEQRRIISEMSALLKWEKELKIAAACFPEGSEAARLSEAVGRRRASYAARLADIETEIAAVEEALSGLPAHLRGLVRARAIDGLSWVRIGHLNNISHRHAQRLYAQALERLAYLMRPAWS